MAHIPGFCFARDLGIGVRVATRATWRLPLHLIGSGLTVSGLVLGPLVMSACAAGSQAPTGPDSGESSLTSDRLLARTATLPTLSQPPPAPNSESTVTLRGWLSIVWNDEPHFFLASDDGMTVEVLLDERLTAPFGGPLALDRSRVVVLAVVTQASPTIFEALSIEREAEG